ncbi:MAG TPA: head maturation protease, ClpP-related, partial [Phycisphaerae bacterium]|nr:head maturation protease, ClpP-related [Phycisphaerae bacterium]
MSLLDNLTSPSFRVNVSGGVAEIVLYDVIDPVFGTGAKQIKEELDAAGEVSEIHLRINSEGGNVFEGLAIYNLLKQHSARVIVHVDGTALSAASFVAMAGDEIEVAENSWLMVHNPVIDLAGADAAELRRNADLIDGLREQLIG